MVSGVHESSIPEAVTALSNGEMVIVVDDEHRENEGDLIVAAEHITSEQMAFMIRHTTGIICVPVLKEKAEALGLELMVENNRESMRTAFTNSVDAASGVTTGVSAPDRTATVKSILSSDATSEDIVSPGHMFPLISNPGGVAERPGHTEASIDLLKLACCEPVAVIAEVMNDDGTMARASDLEKFAEFHSLVIASIADLVDYVVNE